MSSELDVLENRRNANRESWDRFLADPAPEHRQALVARYLKLLYRNASAVSRRIPSLDRDEAISFGYIGLSQAIDRFEPARGLSFSTFACPRIRGAMLDEVRRRSPRSRPANQRQRQLESARRSAEARLLRNPAGPEVARELGLSMNEYWVWRDEGQSGREVSLDQVTPSPGGKGAGVVGDRIPDPAALEFAERVESENEEHLVRRAVATLPPRERAAVEAHYFDEKPYREVGAMLRVSGSRACEIVQRGIALLREQLGAMSDPSGRMVGA